jgi:hypothetical protein
MAKVESKWVRRISLGGAVAGLLAIFGFAADWADLGLPVPIFRSQKSSVEEAADSRQVQAIQQSIQGAPGAIQAGRDVNIGNPAIEADIKEILRRTEKPIYEKLRDRFPRGYALLYADIRRRLTYEERGHSVDIDWSALELVELSDYRITIRGPDIRGAGFTKPTMTADRVVGRAGAATSANFQVVFEVLATTSDGVVAVVGACASSKPFCS